MWKCSIIVVAGILVLFSATTQAAVIDFYWDQYGDPSKSTHTCSFDYALQQFTIVDTFYEIDLRPHISLGTLLDSPSTFSVVETIVNNTGLTWTAYELVVGWPLITGSPAMVVEDSVTSTKLQRIAFSPFGVELTGLPVGLDGESFTIEYDLQGSGPHYRYHNQFIHICCIFTEPSASIWRQIVLGWVLRRGPMTVTGIFRCLGNPADRHWTVYEKFFYRAQRPRRGKAAGAVRRLIGRLRWQWCW